MSSHANTSDAPLAHAAGAVGAVYVPLIAQPTERPAVRASGPPGRFPAPPTERPAVPIGAQPARDRPVFARLPLELMTMVARASASRLDVLSLLMDVSRVWNAAAHAVYPSVLIDSGVLFRNADKTEDEALDAMDFLLEMPSRPLNGHEWGIVRNQTRKVHLYVRRQPSDIVRELGMRYEQTQLEADAIARPELEALRTAARAERATRAAPFVVERGTWWIHDEFIVPRDVRVRPGWTSTQQLGPDRVDELAGLTERSRNVVFVVQPENARYVLRIISWWPNDGYMRGLPKDYPTTDAMNIRMSRRARLGYTNPADRADWGAPPFPDAATTKFVKDVMEETELESGANKWSHHLVLWRCLRKIQTWPALVAAYAEGADLGEIYGAAGWRSLTRYIARNVARELYGPPNNRQPIILPYGLPSAVDADDASIWALVLEPHMRRAIATLQRQIPDARARLAAEPHLRFLLLQHIHNALPVPPGATIYPFDDRADAVERALENAAASLRSARDMAAAIIVADEMSSEQMDVLARDPRGAAILMALGTASDLGQMPQLWAVLQPMALEIVQQRA